METIRDYAKNEDFSAECHSLLIQRVIAHEVAHEFRVEDEQGPAPSIMHDEKWDMENPWGSRFNESQQRTIRTRQESPD